MVRSGLAGIALVLVAIGAHAGDLAVPPLRARVTDLAALLPADVEARLEHRLADFEDETTHQIAILTIPTLDGEPIESFALRTVEAWRLGRAEADNGILLLVVAQDRRARIEVGYGLEGVVPDLVAKRVLEEVLFPRLRTGDLAGGIDAAAEALIQAAHGEEVSALRRPRVPLSERGEDPLAKVFFLSLLGLFAALPFRSSRKARPLAAAVGGISSAALVHLFLGTWTWTLLGLVLGALLGWFGPPKGTVRRSGQGSRGSHLGRFGGGPSRGSFGGGGGGFGGGGASGSW